MEKRFDRKTVQDKLKQSLNRRINIIFLIITALIMLLILKVGYLQLIKGETYAAQIAAVENVEINNSVPRGRIFDRNGVPLVTNSSQKSIMYTRDRVTSQSELLDISKKLTDYIKMPIDNITERDKKDFWIISNRDKVEERMQKELDLFKDGSLSQQEYDQALLKKITDKDLESISDDELQQLAIFRIINGASELAPVEVKGEDVTEEEYATVSQNLDELPGVSTSMDWDRVYPEGDVLKTIFGKVSSKEEGLPKDLLDYYMARGYERNDRVGKSFLEEQYELTLSGKKTKMRYVTDKSGKIKSTEVIEPGQRGDDLVLTIDIKFQKKLEEIVEKHLKKLQKMDEKWSEEPIMDRAFIVVQDPRNGDILAMVGKIIDEDGNVSDYAYGTYQTQYMLGSSVKGATVLTAYQNNDLQVGQEIVDEGLKFKGRTSLMTSFFNPTGSKYPMDDREALQRSSNIYMYKLGLKAMGLNYSYNMGLPLDVSEASEDFQKGFHQFGLGVETQIDLPNESKGYQPKLQGDFAAIQLLQATIGQHYSYTPMQATQYVSSIANDGYRLRPHIVKEVRSATNNDELGPIKRNVEGTILNRIDNSNKEFKQVQNGFLDVYNKLYGTGYEYFAHKLPVTAAGKTGTAQRYIGKKNGEDQFVYNLTNVGYAPAENPVISFASIVPDTPMKPDRTFLPSHEIEAEMITEYFKLNKHLLPENSKGFTGEDEQSVKDGNDQLETINQN